MNKIMKVINQKPKGVRWVISDIHGCTQTFQRLIHKINLSPTDHLFLLGDYIDKGPDSAGVIEHIISLQNEGFMVYPLLGNHELNLVETSQEYNTRMFRLFVVKINKAGNLLDENSKIKPHIEGFIQSLPYAYVLEDYYLVHAGFDFRKENPFEDFMAMLHIRNFQPKPELLGKRQIVHGHHPAYLKAIKEAIQSNAPSIPLDNGAVYGLKQKHKIYDLTQMGQLCAFNLDTKELITEAVKES